MGLPSGVSTMLVPVINLFSCLRTRLSYNTAKQIKDRQDEYCARVFSNDWTDLGEFPESLQWEALVDVLRGRVKVCVNHTVPAIAILVAHDSDSRSIHTAMKLLIWMRWSGCGQLPQKNLDIQLMSIPIFTVVK